MLIDLDRFKNVNDTLGHDAGDALLAEAAKSMRASLRVADRPAKIGGDEFAISIEDFAGMDGADITTLPSNAERPVAALLRNTGCRTSTPLTSDVAFLLS